MKTARIKELKSTIQRWIDGSASISDLAEILHMSPHNLNLILYICELAYPSGRPWEALTAQDIYDTLSWNYLGLLLNRTKMLVNVNTVDQEAVDEPTLKL